MILAFERNPDDECAVRIQCLENTHTEIQTDKRTNTLTHRHIQRDRHINAQTCTDRQLERLTGKQTHSYTYTKTANVDEYTSS